MIAGWLLEQSINGPDLVDSCVGTTGPTAMVAVVVGPMGTTAGDVGCCGSDRIASALWCYGASAEVIPSSVPVAMGKSKGTELAFCENKSK